MKCNIDFWSNVIPAWLSAMGTVGAVIVAIFARPIRDWWCRPKITTECNPNNKACVEVINSETETSDTSQSIKIRILLQNNGSNVAFHSVLNVDSFYKKREKSVDYVQNDFTPKRLKDHCDSTHSRIAPHLKYYYDVAVIKQADEMMDKDGDKKAKQFYKLYLLGDGKILQLGKGEFIIPLKFYAANVNVHISYLKIYWNSDDFTTDSNQFGVELLPKDEFIKLKIYNN